MNAGVFQLVDFDQVKSIKLSTISAKTTRSFVCVCGQENMLRPKLKYSEICCEIFPILDQLGYLILPSQLSLGRTISLT